MQLGRELQGAKQLIKECRSTIHSDGLRHFFKINHFIFFNLRTSAHWREQCRLLHARHYRCAVSWCCRSDRLQHNPPRCPSFLHSPLRRYWLQGAETPSRIGRILFGLVAGKAAITKFLESIPLRYRRSHPAEFSFHRLEQKLAHNSQSVSGYR